MSSYAVGPDSLNAVRDDRIEVGELEEATFR